MDQNWMKRQRELTDRLNRYRNEYYNLNSPSVSDTAYDRLFEELQAVEKQTGVQMANSPTNTVGYPAVSKLEKTNHSIPLLSLDKVKNTEELCRFIVIAGIEGAQVLLEVGFPLGAVGVRIDGGAQVVQLHFGAVADVDAGDPHRGVQKQERDEHDDPDHKEAGEESDLAPLVAKRPAQP